jgi:pyridoxine 5-phosphate synthase
VSTSARAGTSLSVNLNKVATLRNTRTIGIPSVTRAARIALDAGAHGITLHPRPDERHIRPTDVIDIARLVADYQGAAGGPSIELNIEGNPFEGLVEHALRVRPAQCTLVPDSVSQSTSDHGWNLADDGARLAPVIAQLKAVGCRVSLFMDAVPEAIARARDVGADRVELYTEPYAAAFARGAHAEVVGAFRESAKEAGRVGLGVNAGHDLNLANLGPFLAEVPGVLEVSIGHALIADALELGLAETVRRYLAIVRAR